VSIFSHLLSEEILGENRLTRLGEFSPTGLFRSFLKMTEEANIFGLLNIFHGTSYVLILSKNMLGYILGDFSQTPWLKIPLKADFCRNT
jgi:ribosomal protein S19